MIRATMNKSITILCQSYNIKGKRPRYINLWTFPKVAEWLLKRGVPQEKIEILLDIYRTVRFE